MASQTDHTDNNIIIMSQAGKPIFSRFGSVETVTHQCGLIQALRTAALPAQLGEMQSLQAGRLSMVLMTVGSITLLSIQNKSRHPSELFARLQLEYLYAQLIFIMTDQIHKIYQQDPAYDLRSMIVSNENLLHGILDESGPNGCHAGPMLVEAIPMLHPISPKARQHVSKTLQSIGQTTENTAFALLITGGKLLSLVQPAFRPHQLRVSDLHLLLNLLNRRGMHNSELWIPVCLPRFHSSAFMHAYTKCLDPAQDGADGTVLILISPHGTTEQFQRFRSAAATLCDILGFRTESNRVLTVRDATRDGQEDVEWKREESFDVSEEDFVSIPTESERRRYKELLLQEIRAAQLHSSWDALVRNYMTEEKDTAENTQGCDGRLLLHFLFRMDITIQNCSRQSSAAKAGKGHLSQCISPPIPFASTEERQRLWCNYAQLSLRLRLGSATTESSMDAFDMITQDQTSHGGFPGIAKDCPGIGLLESPPNDHGVSYIVEESKIFLAMNGRGFEL